MNSAISPYRELVGLRSVRAQLPRGLACAERPLPFAPLHQPSGRCLVTCWGEVDSVVGLSPLAVQVHFEEHLFICEGRKLVAER